MVCVWFCVCDRHIGELHKTPEQPAISCGSKDGGPEGGTLGGNMSGFDGSSQRTFVDGTVDTMRLTDKPTNSAIRDKLCLKFEKVGPPRTHCSPV